MSEVKLKPCPFCGSVPIIEYWRSGGSMYMVKCNNPHCDVPYNGYPSGHNFETVKRAWNTLYTEDPSEINENAPNSGENNLGE